MLRIVRSALVSAALLVFVPPVVAAQEKAPGRPAAAATAAAKSAVNINTATAADFEGLPGIGARTAARIVEYRQKNGPFKKVEELMNVRGLGEKSFLKLKPQLTVGAAKADHED
jgi:competence protein ComEA